MPEYRDDQPHLFNERPTSQRMGSTLPADGDAEGVCTCCGARVTVGSDGDEYGHGYGCPHRLESVSARQTVEHQISEHICPECGRGDFETQKQMRCHHAGAHGCSTREERTCEHCGEAFTPNRSRQNPQQYCSPECSQLARRDRVEITCAACSDLFETTPYEVDHGKKYCSEACKYDGLRAEVTLTCETCDEEYQVKRRKAEQSRFCSSRCLGQANAARSFDNVPGGVAGD